MIRYIPTQPDHDRTHQTRRRPADEGVLASLASRLTTRDRWLLRLLHDHQVFTSPQICQLAYTSQDRARHGMLRLARTGVVERFRPLLPPGSGSAPLHYVIGQAGARVLAAERGISLTELGYRRDRVLALAYSPRLTHLIGVNGLFTALTATARRHPTARLDKWWPEQRCTHTWGSYARPDAYGRWHEDDTDIDFFVEYDTGTEPLPKVAAKLRGYADLAAVTGLTTPVLIWTSTTKRETNLRHHLRSAPVPTATATAQLPDNDSGPAGPIWLPAGQPDSPRLRLIQLTRRAGPPPHTSRQGDESRDQHDTDI